jgi:hypothetical protein
MAGYVVTRPSGLSPGRGWTSPKGDIPAWAAEIQLILAGNCRRKD